MTVTKNIQSVASKNLSKSVIQTKKAYKQTEIGWIPEDWDLKLIDNIVKISTGSKNTQDKISDGKYPFYVRSKTIERINSFSYDCEAVLTVGDGVGTGKVFHYVNEKFELHQRVYIMNEFVENLDGYYFYLFFSNNFYSRVVQMTAKSSVDSVRREMIAGMKVPLPPLTEQKAISEVLSDTDNLIQAIEQKLNKKRAIKQGAMQKLLAPKEDWEAHSFPRLCWFQEGPGVRKHQFTKNGVKLLNGTNIEKGQLLLDKTDKFVSDNEANGSYSHFLVDAGDILIACSGITISKFEEKVTIVNNKHLPLCMNTSTMRFKVKDKALNKNFLFHFLKSDSFKTQIGGKATGSAQLNFGPSHVSKVNISLPKPNVQTEIATILSDMDAEIEQLEQKLYKYKLIKQGLMQNLLTGKIRLV